MPPRHPRHTFLLVAANGRPLAILRGLPTPQRTPRASQGDTLVYDLGRLERTDHARLVDALATLRELPYLAEGAPSALLVGGMPAMTLGADGKPAGEGLGSRLRDLLRTTR